MKDNFESITLLINKGMVTASAPYYRKVQTITLSKLLLEFGLHCLALKSYYLQTDAVERVSFFHDLKK